MNRLTLSAKLWVYTAACLLAVGYIVLDYILPEAALFNEDSSHLQKMIDLKKSKLMNIKTQNQRKGKLESEIKAVENEFRRLKEMFPEKDIIPQRLQDLNKAARRSTITPQSFVPIKTEKKEFYTENYYNVKINSGFHGLGNFFAEIANFKYPTAITNVEVAQNPMMYLSSPGDTIEFDENRLIVAGFQLKTYTAE